MKINAAGMNVKTFKYSFKSLRTDKKNIEQLRNGEQPILENNKQNIYAALNNLSSNPERENIEFLLEISDNLTYGQGGANSEFKDFLDSESLTPEERENTDWSALLDDTIRKAISASDEDVSDLEAEYQRIFTDKRKMTGEQKKLIELRNEFTSLITDEAALDDAETLARTARVRKNTDYFIASSEISAKQKQYCLERFIYLMSDDYKITPQLKDKKLQAIDEMLNDMLIKTPENPDLTIKPVDQRQSGMCAAISACRKKMAYEDKSAYVDLIMEELKDSPAMSVFDITELGTGKKVDIPKTYIDYDTALAKGYRIIDASAHNWMHNAHASGDGTIQTEYYIPFSDEEYGVYDDSSWYLGIAEDKIPAKSLLQALIKEREYLKSFLKTRKEMKETGRNVLTVKKEVNTHLAAAGGKLNTTLKEIFPEKSDREIREIQNSLLKFYTGTSENNEANISKKMPRELKQQLCADFIINSVSDITDEQKSKVKEKSDIIYSMTDEYTLSDERLKKIKRFSSQRSKYIYNRKLFKLAASHRLAIEADVNMPDGAIRFEKLTGLPPRNIQITDYLKSLQSSLTPEQLTKIRQVKENNVLDKNKVEKELASDLIKIESTIPAELDLIAQNMFGMSISQLAARMFTNISLNIQNGDTKLLEDTKIFMNLDCDKNKVIEKLNKQAEKLSKPHSMEETLEAVRLLGYEDCFNFLSVFIESFLYSITQEGMSEEQYYELAERFGGEDKIASGLELQRQSFKELKEEYDSIQEKWQVPSSRENILKKLEKQNAILSRRKLDILKNRFDSISAASVKNESIENMKARNAANDKLYKFSNEEQEIFDSIEKSVSSMKKYCKMEYANLNDILYDDLEEQYAYIGKLNGQFWVREEGSSGLSANEQIRIIEQMTGKPYHAEDDITEAAKDIKKGQGSGVVSLSVDDGDYAFHAMYVPAVTAETFTKSPSMDKITRDILWTDNSWGNSEKEYFWNGHNGFYYTDYDRGFGWKDGFILAPDKKIGLPVDDIHGATGIEPEEKEKFGLYIDTILPGVPIDSYQKLYKMFNYILNMNEGEILLSALESDINDGAKFSIEELEGLDDAASAKEAQLEKRINSEIKTKADFDKLPDDDELKFAFKKLAVYMSTNNPEAADEVLTVNNNDELQEVFENIVQEHFIQFASIAGKSTATMETLQILCRNDIKTALNNSGFALSDKDLDIILDLIFFDEKTSSSIDGSLQGLENYLLDKTVQVAVNKFDSEDKARQFIEITQTAISRNIKENIKIKSLDDAVLANSPLKDEFIAAIDKYLKPKSDGELLDLIQGLQLADNNATAAFFDALSPEDLGITYKDPYHYVQLFQTENQAVRKAFSEIVMTNEIYSNLKCSNKDEASTPEEIYRSMYVKLSDLDVQKYINAFKAEAFQKYKLRQAFPQPVVIADNDIAKTVNNMLKQLNEEVSNIKMSQYLIDIFTRYSKIINNFSSSQIYQSLINLKDFEITQDNSDSVDEFLNALVDLSTYISLDDTLENINNPLKKLISTIDESDNTIDGKAAGAALRELISVYKDFESSGVSEEKYIQLKKEELNSLNQQIQLMVNANIDSRYRNDASELIKRYIDLLKKDAPEEEIKEQESAITDFIVDKHIVKNPTELLKKCTKLLMEGKSSSDEYQVLRIYLTSALKVAQQTKIQYKMVQNQHLGIGSKIKDMLSLFNVYLADGTSADMSTDAGMLYLIEQLKNTDDNCTTLKLFMEQSGLSAQALRAILNNFDINKIKELVDEKADELKASIEDMEEIANTSEDFFSSSRIKYKSVEDAINHLKSYMKRKLKNYKQIPTYNTYITYLDSITYGESNNSLNQSMIDTLTREINLDAMNYVADSMNSGLDYIKGISEMTQERAEIIASFNVPKSSEEYAMREKFFEKYNDTQTYINSVFDEIQEYAERSRIVYTELE